MLVNDITRFHLKSNLMLSNNVIFGFYWIEFWSSQIPSSWHLLSLSDPLTSSVGATLWRPLVQGHFDKSSLFLWRSSCRSDFLLSVTLPYCKGAKEVPLSLWKVFQFATLVLIWQKTIIREIMYVHLLKRQSSHIISDFGQPPSKNITMGIDAELQEFEGRI